MFAGVTLLVSIFNIWCYTRIALPWLEDRQGMLTLPDPIHQRLPLVNMGVLITDLTLLAELLFFYFLLLQWSLTLWIQVLFTFSVLWLLRSLCMFLCPLKCPNDAYYLNDPVVRFFTHHGEVQEFRHDLFFSGHISFLTLCALFAPPYRMIFIGIAVVVSICMLLSRIHYTIDLVVAPFMAFTVYSLLGPVS